jgi:hypothetical protein
VSTVAKYTEEINKKSRGESDFSLGRWKKWCLPVMKSIIMDGQQKNGFFDIFLFLLSVSLTFFILVLDT